MPRIRISETRPADGWLLAADWTRNGSVMLDQTTVLTDERRPYCGSWTAAFGAPQVPNVEPPAAGLSQSFPLTTSTALAMSPTEPKPTRFATRVLSATATSTWMSKSVVAKCGKSTAQRIEMSASGSAIPLLYTGAGTEAPVQETDGPNCPRAWEHRIAPRNPPNRMKRNTAKPPLPASFWHRANRTKRRNSTDQSESLPQ